MQRINGFYPEQVGSRRVEPCAGVPLSELVLASIPPRRRDETDEQFRERVNAVEPSVPFAYTAGVNWPKCATKRPDPTDMTTYPTQVDYDAAMVKYLADVELTRWSLGEFTPIPAKQLAMTKQLLTIVLNPSLGNPSCLHALSGTRRGRSILALIGAFTRIMNKDVFLVVPGVEGTAMHVPSHVQLPLPNDGGIETVRTNRIFIETRPVFPRYLGVNTIVMWFASMNNLLDFGTALVGLVAENAAAANSTGRERAEYERRCASDPSYGITSMAKLGALVVDYTGRPEHAALIAQLENPAADNLAKFAFVDIFTDHPYYHMEGRFPGCPSMMLRRPHKGIRVHPNLPTEMDIRVFETRTGVLCPRLYLSRDAHEYAPATFMAQQMAAFPGHESTFSRYKPLLEACNVSIVPEIVHGERDDEIAKIIHGLGPEHGAKAAWTSMTGLSSAAEADLKQQLAKTGETTDIDISRVSPRSLLEFTRLVSSSMGIKSDHAALSALMDFEAPGLTQPEKLRRTSMFMDVTLDRLTQFCASSENDPMASNGERMHAAALLEHVAAVRASNSPFIPADYVMHGDASLHGMSAVVEQLLRIASHMGTYSGHNVLVYLYVMACSAGHYSFSDQVRVVLMGETSMGKSTLFDMLAMLLAGAEHVQHQSAHALNVHGTVTSRNVLIDEADNTALGMEKPSGSSSSKPSDDPKVKAYTSSGVGIAARYEPVKDAGAGPSSRLVVSIQCAVGSPVFMACNLLPDELTRALRERMSWLVVGELDRKAFRAHGPKSEHPLNLTDPNVAKMVRPWKLLHTLVTVVQWALTTDSLPLQADLSIFDAFWNIVQRRMTSLGLHMGSERKTVHARGIALNCLLISTIFNRCFAPGAEWTRRRDFTLPDFIAELVPALTISSADAQTACGLALVEMLPVATVRTIMAFGTACGGRDPWYDESVLESYRTVIEAINDAPDAINALIRAEAEVAKRRREDAEELAAAVAENRAPRRKLFVSSSMIASEGFKLSRRAPDHAAGVLAIAAAAQPAGQLTRVVLREPQGAQLTDCRVDREEIARMLAGTLPPEEVLEHVGHLGRVGHDDAASYQTLVNVVAASVGEFRAIGERAQRTRMAQVTQLATQTNPVTGSREGHYVTYKADGKVGTILAGQANKPGTMVFTGEAYEAMLRIMATYPLVRSDHIVGSTPETQARVTGFFPPVMFKASDGRGPGRYSMLRSFLDHAGKTWGELVMDFMNELVGPFYDGGDVLIPNMEGVPGTAIRLRPVPAATNVCLGQRARRRYSHARAPMCSPVDAFFSGDTSNLRALGFGIDSERGNLDHAAFQWRCFRLGVSPDVVADARVAVRNVRDVSYLLLSALVKAGFDGASLDDSSNRIKSMVAAGSVQMLPEFPYNQLRDVAAAAVYRSVQRDPDINAIQTFIDFVKTAMLPPSAAPQAIDVRRFGMPDEYGAIYGNMSLPVLFYAAATRQLQQAVSSQQQTGGLEQLRRLVPPLAPLVVASWRPRQSFGRARPPRRAIEHGPEPMRE